MRIFLLAVLVANGEAVCYCPQATTIVEQSCRDTGCTCTNGEASCGLQLAGGSVISNIFSRFANSVTRKEVTTYRRLKNPPDKPFVHTKNEFFQEVRSKIKEEGRDEVVEQVFEKAKEALTDNSINEYEKRNNYSTYSGFMKLACSTVSSATVCTNLTWRCCQKYAAATSPVVTDSCPTTGKCSAASLKACDTQECRCGMVNGSSVFTCGENCITTGRCPSYHICGDKECVCVSLTSYKCVSNSVANSAHGLSPFETLPLCLFLTALVVTELIN